MVKIKALEELEKETSEEEEVLGSQSAVFTCPDCEVITQDDVIFTCNVCESDKLIYKEGVYMCPQCLAPGENFQCMKCGNKNVKLTFDESKKEE